MTTLFGANGSTFQATVTGTAGRIIAVSTSAPRANGGILVKALAGNSQTVYIGFDANVTTGTGFPLEAGVTLSIPLDDPSKIYAISTSGSQTLAVFYV